MNPNTFLKIYLISVSSEDSELTVEIHTLLQKDIKH